MVLVTAVKMPCVFKSDFRPVVHHVIVSRTYLVALVSLPALASLFEQRDET